MTTTETRLLPKSLVDDCHQALARLRFARDIDKDHPVMPPRQEYRKGEGFRPHPIDCDICSAQRLIDILLDDIRKAIGKAKQP